MKSKKVSLRVWMFLKIAPSVLLVLMYWMNVRTDSHPIHIAITLIILVFFGVFSHYDKRTDLFDELAKENLRRTDSICLKTAYAFGIACIFAVIISNRLLVDLSNVTAETIGYGVVFSILVFTILRAFVFSIIDKRLGGYKWLR